MSFQLQDNDDLMVGEINMTPLVDVMLVLLVLFLITVPALQSNLNIQLPSTATRTSTDSTEPIQIGLKIDGSVFINQQLVAAEDWVKTIQMLQKNSAQTSVSIDADKQLPYENIAKFLAVLQTNGINKVKFKTLVAH
jgi:biopolymer transport protein ExbD